MASLPMIDATPTDIDAKQVLVVTGSPRREGKNDCEDEAFSRPPFHARADRAEWESEVARQTLDFPIAVADRFKAAPSIPFRRRRRNSQQPTLPRFRQCAHGGRTRPVLLGIVRGAGRRRIRIRRRRYPISVRQYVLLAPMRGTLHMPPGLLLKRML
jgi:hypothetical protein